MSDKKKVVFDSGSEIFFIGSATPDPNQFHGVSVLKDTIIQSLMFDLQKTQSKLSLAVEALRTIAEHNTLGGEKYNNYASGYVGVVEYAQKALKAIETEVEGE